MPRIAVVSDIHGNLTALEAVIADLKEVGPDLVVHGGDLLGAGGRQREVIDRIRDLGWPGVYGNADEMLWNPDALATFLAAPAFDGLRRAVASQAAVTVEAIGPERLAWLRALPKVWRDGDVTVVHARPEDVWRSPSANATDEELQQVYGPLKSACAIYGHVHTPFVRRIHTLTVANSGSVSLSYDGDPRAAYALVEDGHVTIRRVAYDIEREVALLHEARFPHADWIAAMLRDGLPRPVPEG